MSKSQASALASQASASSTSDLAFCWLVLQGDCRHPRSESHQHRHHVEPCGGGVPRSLHRTSSERGGFMTCLHDGILRARLDAELDGSELQAVNQHLAVCADCRSRFEKLSAETARTQELLASLASKEGERDPAAAYAQFSAQFGTVPEPKPSWINRLFAPRWRPAWGLAAAAVAVAILVGVGPVRLLAQRVLAIFGA